MAENEGDSRESIEEKQRRERAEFRARLEEKLSDEAIQRLEIWTNYESRANWEK